jgi:hypothetical protein
MLKLIRTLTTPVLDRLGDWNPQLLRELKGRVKGFPVMMAIGLSLLVQVIVLFCFTSALPGAIEVDDLVLTTYPQIQWSVAAQLPESLQTEVLPTEPLAQRMLRAKGQFINRVQTTEAVRGNVAIGQNALQQLRPGDRLVALDGVPMEELEAAVKVEVSGDADAIWLQAHRDALVRQMATQIRGTNQYHLTERQLPLIDTTVALTLYRPGRGEFTVELPRIATLDHWSDYCLPRDDEGRQCRLSADKQAYLVDWLRWHRHVFITLSTVMTLALMGLGMFLLANNVVEEKRRGTLNFLRMSPRSALTILGGKLLGVPICLYLAIAVMVPWQTYAGLSAGFHSTHLLGFDIALVSQTLILYMVALLLGLATRVPMLMALLPWLAAAGGLAFQWLVGLLAHEVWDGGMPIASPLDWAVLFSPLGSAGYFVDMTRLANHYDKFDLAIQPVTFQPEGLNLALSIFRVNFAEYTLLTVLHAWGWGLVLGHALQRRFEHPTKSLLARRYSYWLTAIFMAILLGLSETSVNDYDLFPLLSLITLLGVLYGLVMVLSLTCDRQILQDWARFRTSRLPHEGRLPLGRDLLLGETSSPLIAIGLNLALMATLFVTWFMLCHRQVLDHKIDVFGIVGGLLLFVGSIFFAALASQVLLLAKRQKSWFWFGSLGSISCLLFPGLTLAIGIGVTPATLTGITLWGLPPEVVAFVIPLSLMGSLTGLLAGVHWWQFRMIGKSESQSLLAGANSIGESKP